MKLNIGVLIVLIGSFLSFGARAEPPPGVPPGGNPIAALQELVEELAASQLALQGRVGDLETSVAGLEASLGAAEAAITALQADLAAANGRIDALEANPVLELSGVLSLDNSSGYATVVVSGANLQVVNGTGVTETANGLGNILVGYNAPGYFLEIDPDGEIETCSDGQYLDQASCELNGGTWANSHKTGSHYVVIGDHNNYSRYVGLVTGQNNALRAPHGAVTGGRRNQVTREWASISGGRDNRATQFFATISGGRDNIASGSFSHVSGGEFNEATNLASAVLGGDGNTASGQYSSVSGGVANEAAAFASSVSGGGSNTANAHDSSVSGGVGNTANHSGSSILGGDSQVTSFINQTIPALP